MNVQIFFRVDSSSRIGTGHVMRSLTLAKFLQNRRCSFNNYFISFISSDLSGNINDKIRKDFPLHVIRKGRYADDPRVQYDWETDCRQTTDIIKGLNIDLLIVDHYSLDYRWETCIKNYTRKLMAIDDIFRQHNSDILLDQNINATCSRYLDLTPICSKLLIGTKYVLLDSQFNTRFRKNHTGEIRRVHICFGGSDVNNLTERVVRFILDNSNSIENYDRIIFDVIVGGSNKNFQSIKKLLENRNNFNLLRDVNNMAELLFKSDLAIGAGGTSAYERCYVGIPSLIVTIADNQIDISALLQREETSIYLGHMGWSNEYFINSFNLFIKDKTKVILFSKNSKKIIDGYGPSRVENCIENLLTEM